MEGSLEGHEEVFEVDLKRLIREAREDCHWEIMLSGTRCFCFEFGCLGIWLGYGTWAWLLTEQTGLD